MDEKAVKGTNHRLVERWRNKAAGDLTPELHKEHARDILEGQIVRPILSRTRDFGIANRLRIDHHNPNN
ncbi:MAG: hypothetical protein KGR69_02095 [Verrucomicrobia bacterium]|nr:hypothetical protein [Verrucomicrobiota bacterium]